MSPLLWMYNIKSIKSTQLIYTTAASYGLAYIKYHKITRKIKICTFSCLNNSIINIENYRLKTFTFSTHPVKEHKVPYLKKNLVICAPWESFKLSTKYSKMHTFRYQVGICALKSTRRAQTVDSNRATTEF